MTLRARTLLIAVIGTATIPAAHPYELTTHAGMTYKAYQASRLGNDPSIARDLGIDWFLADPGANYEWDSIFKSTNPFGKTYIDSNSSSGGSDLPRQASEAFEGKIIQAPTLRVPQLTVPGWLMRGAIREDDGNYVVGSFNNEPLDDPYGNFNRFCNHFFDPTQSFNRAATFALCALSVYQDAANWALGTNDAFASPTTGFSARRNHFTATDAREALYRAVTGQRKDGSTVGTGNADADFTTRKSYYATMFRALGDVMHLNQDMAQPQHTRNESHAGIGGGWNIGGNPAYEKRTDSRAKGEGRVDVNGALTPLPALNYGSYGAPRFARLSDYWSTAPGLPVPTGKGMADYSNPGFFTLDNNYGSTRYQSPRSVPELYTRDSKTFIAGSSSVTMTYLRGSVADAQSGSADSILLTKEGVWKDLVTGATSEPPAYTLDNVIFDDMASLLVPRAVGYSTGILDYFFRGKMQITPPDGGVYALLDHSKVSIDSGELRSNFKGFAKIKIKLSAPANGNDGQAQSFGGGKLLAAVKFRRNTCFDNDLTQFTGLDQVGADGNPKYQGCRTLAEEIIVSDPVNGGGTFTPTTDPQPLTLTFSRQLPLNATDVRLQVVYRGKLGAEDDEVVVATQDLSEPTFFSYMNASDYSAIDMGSAGVQVFTRSEINASQVLLQKISPQSCVDKTVSPWQLRPSCLQPFDVRLGFRVGAFKVDVQALPVRRLMRIAFLADADSQVALAQIPENTCYPHDPFGVDSLEWQSNPDPDNDPTATYPEFQKIRGVWGWYGTSCVFNADGLSPGTPDNRNAVMTDLADSEKAPFEATIDDGDLPPL
jgi:hypothetical protein